MKSKITAIALAAAFAAAALCVGACAPHVHRFGAWEVLQAPSCTQDGARRRTCPDDDAEETEVLYALGHAYGEDNVCTRCGREIVYTPDLEYFEIDGGWEVALGKAGGKDIVIPAYYEGKPVLSVREEGFRFYRTFASDGTVQSLPSACESVWIPDGVTSIGVRAFYGCENLRSVTLPTTLKTIDDQAFAACELLSDVHYERYIETLGNEAFRDCVSLTEAPLSAELKTIGANAFRGCEGLTVVATGDALTRIKEGAFSECRGLSRVSLGRGVVYIEAKVFYGCRNLIEVGMYDHVDSIGISVFEGCYSLERIRYNGVMSQWQGIAKELGWDGPSDSVGNYVVRCTDGDIKKPTIPEDAN